MWKHLDIDALLSEEERVPCIFKSEADGLGFLDRSGEFDDLNAGTKVELPLWMAQVLSKKSMVSLELPKHFDKKMRDHIAAGAVTINLKEFSVYYYEVGMQLAQSLKDDDLRNTLRIAFTGDRYKALMVNSLMSSQEENTSYVQELTAKEAQIFYDGVRAARELDDWKKNNISSSKSSILGRRKLNEVYSSSSAVPGSSK